MERVQGERGVPVAAADALTAPAPGAGADPGPRRRPDAARLAAVVLPAAVAVAARWPSLHQPLDRDTAAYATIGSSIWKGVLPYRDLFDHKQPLVYPVYAAIDLLGTRTSSVRLAAMAVAALTAVSVAVLGRRLLGPGRALLAGCMVAVVGAMPEVEGFDLNTEHLLAPLTAGAVLVAVRFRRRPWAPAVAGLLLGLALVTKVVAVFVAPAVLLPLVWLPMARPQLVRRLVVFGGAAAAPALVVVAVYAAAGGLDALVEANITYNRVYVASQQPELGRFLRLRPTFVAALVVAGAVAGALRLASERDDRPGVAALMLWLAGAWVGAKFGGRDFPHYFAPVVAPAIVLVLVPLGVRPLAAFRAAAPAVLAVQLVVLGWCVRTVPGDLAKLFSRSPQEVALLVFGDQARTWAEYEPVGARLRATERPGDTLFVAGAEPGFYWFSGATVAGRYPYDYPLLVDPARLPAFQEDLCREPPTRVLLPYGADWPPYLAVLDPSAYRPEFVAGTVHVFRAEPGRPCPSA